MEAHANAHSTPLKVQSCRERDGESNAVGIMGMERSPGGTEYLSRPLHDMRRLKI